MRKKFTLFFMILAVAFILTGVFMGQYRDVLNKAVRVCMECVGIG